MFTPLVLKHDSRTGISNNMQHKRLIVSHLPTKSAKSDLASNNNE